MDRTPFHRHLRKERKLRGWTQSELARTARVPRSQIAHYELGTRMPPADHVARLAAALGIAIEAPIPPPGKGGWPAWKLSALWERFTPHPRRYRLDRERDSWVRLLAARKAYPLLYGLHFPRVVALHGRAALTELLHFACCGSGLEMMAWLRILEFAVISYVSLARLGWRRLPVIEEPSGDVVGDRLWPVLAFEQPFLCALFPQVRVRTPGQPYRMDLLACLRVGDRLVWLNVEIDGPLHDSEYDRKRQIAIGLPRVRLTEDDVCARNFKQRFLEKLAAAAGVELAA
ncbi:MAG: hypothetical protein AMXMBFR33_34920 [Candidatus Xenobia bacterium]